MYGVYIEANAKSEDCEESGERLEENKSNRLTPEKLREAVKKVGNSADAMERELKRVA